MLDRIFLEAFLMCKNVVGIVSFLCDTLNEASNNVQNVIDLVLVMDVDFHVGIEEVN